MTGLLRMNHMHIEAAVRGGLQTGLALDEMFVIVDFTSPTVSIGIIDRAGIERALPQCGEFLTEALRDLLGMKRHAGWVHVLCFSTDEWSTSRLYVPSQRLTTSVGGTA